MTQAQPSQTRMVIQYGQRDEDDESEYDSDDDRHKGLFGGMMHHASKRNSNNGKRGMPGMNLAASFSQLGASVSSQLSFGGAGHQSGDDLSDDEEDNKSVSSKAKMALKSFGDSMRFTLTKSDDENDSDSSDEEDNDDDSDSGDEMDDDRSVASRTAQAVLKVTGKLTKVLRVGRRSDDDDDDSSVSDSESSDEEEEDPLATNTKKKKILPNLLGGAPNLLGGAFGSSREMRVDESDDSNNSGGGGGGRRRANHEQPESAFNAMNPFRRSKTDQQEPPKKSPGFHRCQTTESRTVYAKAAAQTLAQEQYDTPPTSRRTRQARNQQTQSLTDPRDKNTTRSAAGPGFGRSNTTMSSSRTNAAKAAAKVLAKEHFGEEVWSMNVTEDMLAKATSQGVYVPPSAKR